MSVSAGIAAGAAAQSAAAAAAANAARKTACMKFVKGYGHDAATVTEMREYADCIERLYPAPMTGGDVTATKLAIVFVFLCVALGAWKKRKDQYDGPIERYVVGGLMGLFAALLVLFLGFMAVAGIFYVVSA
jgi:uncharacterized membrane protein